MFQYQSHSHRQVTSAHLTQTMMLLNLTSQELRQQIEAELASNPALEMLEERRCPTCRRLLPGRSACPVCSQPQSETQAEAVVFISPDDHFSGGGEFVDEDEASDDEFSSSSEDLATYVLRQVAPDFSLEDRRIAAFLLTHLDEDGLLTTTPLEIAAYFHIPTSRVVHIQTVIQRADPLGTGSCSTQEALLAQCDYLSETQSVPAFARQIILEGMDELCHRQYHELARRLNAPLKAITLAVLFISENLNPYPARSHWGDVRHPARSAVQVFHKPDIIIGFLNDDPNKQIVVEILLPLQGTLRVNPLFKDAIRQATSEQKETWRSDLERASLFVKCIQQRNHTMLRLMQRVVTLQRDYILKGEESLIQLTRAQIAIELELHESTISRAVQNKTVQLPNRRIVPLSSFFDRSLNVRTVLKGLVSRETSPLSDNQLVNMLAQRGFPVARRTVAKYRSMEGIPPAHLRQMNLKMA